MVSNQVAEWGMCMEQGQIAWSNLQKVLTVLGGRWDDSQQYALVDGFVIGPSNIIRQKDGRHTCYESLDMPVYEKMASAALLLHADPRLFEFWRTNPGWPVVSHSDLLIIRTKI